MALALFEGFQRAAGGGETIPVPLLLFADDTMVFF